MSESRSGSTSKKVLAVGLPESILSHFKSELPAVDFINIVTEQEYEPILDSDGSGFIHTIFCGESISGIDSMEISQSLRGVFPQSRIVFITEDTKELKVNSLKKNGASEAYIYPSDKPLLASELDNIVAQLGESHEGLTRFRSVQLMDIDAGDTVPFDLSVYLPMNNKYIKVVKTGDEVRERQISKFEQKQVGKVYIDSKQTEQFYDYCAEKLAELNDPNSAMSETERREKIQNSVRDLFSTIFDDSDNADFDTGKLLMEQSEKVVSKFLEKKTGISFHKQLESAVGVADDSYNHASSVSTIASLLSMATGIGKPEDLAIAGLFHDIALTGFPHIVEPGQEFIDSLNEDEKATYLDHPSAAQRVLKAKKMTVPQEIVKIIEQHHERADGKGFPKQTNGMKIAPEAQLLHIADLIEYYGQTKEGQKRLRPLEAVQKIETLGSVNIEILVKVKKALQAPADS